MKLYNSGENSKSIVLEKSALFSLVFQAQIQESAIAASGADTQLPTTS